MSPQYPDNPEYPDGWLIPWPVEGAKQMRSVDQTESEYAAECGTSRPRAVCLWPTEAQTILDAMLDLPPSVRARLREIATL